MEKVKTFCAFLGDYPLEDGFRSKIVDLDKEVNEFLKDPNVIRTGVVETVQKNVIMRTIFYKTAN